MMRSFSTYMLIQLVMNVAVVAVVMALALVLGARDGALASVAISTAVLLVVLDIAWFVGYRRRHQSG